MYKKYTRELLVRMPPLFDLAKRLENRLRGVRDDSIILHQMAESIGLEEIVQIGANCGIRNDPVRALVVKYKPKTILVEPDPIAFQFLKRAYAYLVRGGVEIEFRNAYVSPKDLHLNYYSLSENGRRKISKAKQVELVRKSGTNKSKLLGYLSELGFSNVEELVSEVAIQRVSWEELIRENLRGLLVIDTEGLDWKLLSDLDLNSNHPFAVYFESGPEEAWDVNVINKFQDAGYVFKSLKNNSVFYDEGLQQCLAE